MITAINGRQGTHSTAVCNIGYHYTPNIIYGIYITCFSFVLTYHFNYNYKLSEWPCIHQYNSSDAMQVKMNRLANTTNMIMKSEILVKNDT